MQVLFYRMVKILSFKEAVVLIACGQAEETEGKTADDWAREYSSVQVQKKPHLDLPSEPSTPARMLICRYFCTNCPLIQQYDRIREHMSSGRPTKLKADSEKAETERAK